MTVVSASRAESSNLVSVKGTSTVSVIEDVVTTADALVATGVLADVGLGADGTSVLAPSTPLGSCGASVMATLTGALAVGGGVVPAVANTLMTPMTASTAARLPTLANVGTDFSLLVSMILFEVVMLDLCLYHTAYTCDRQDQYSNLHIRRGLPGV